MRIASLICALALMAPLASAAAEHPSPQAALEAAVEAGAPGVSAAIATRKGVVWTGVAGLSDVSAGIPVDEADAFGIGSLTKTFVAVVVLQLAEEGRVALDARVADILGSDVVAGIPNADTATISQLLSHTSGVPSWEDDPAWIRQGRGDALDPARLWKPAQALAFVRGPGHEAIAPPGSRYSYSNSNYTLLGLVIEKVTGAPAASEIRRRIFEPLGMDHTWLEGFEAARGPMARRYHYITPIFERDAGLNVAFPRVTPQLADVTRSNLSVEWTAGAIVTTARDLATFALALRDGRLLEPQSQVYMTAWQPAEPGLEVGHGLFRTTNPRGVFIGHTGNVLGFSAAFWWSQSGDAVAVVLVNAGSMHAGQTPPTGSAVAQRSEFADAALAYAARHGLP